MPATRIAEQTFYAWKKKYAHLGVRELRRLRQVEEENARLKRLVADLSLDKHMLSEALRKSLRPARHRELAQWFHGTFQVSCARTCRLAEFGVHRGIEKVRRRTNPPSGFASGISRMLGPRSASSASGCCSGVKAGGSIANGCVGCIGWMA